MKLIKHCYMLGLMALAAVCEILPTSANPKNDKCQEMRVRSFANISEARRYYTGVLGAKTGKWEGNATVSGGSYREFVSQRTDWYYRESGEYAYSTFAWSQYSCTACGSVLAVPEEKFRIEEVFVYQEKSNVITGMVVSVGVSIVGGGGAINDAVKQNTIKNLAFSGMAIRGDSKNPGGRLLSLKRSSKERYGASQNNIHLGFDQGRVYISLYGCDFAKMKPYVSPLSMEGNKKNNRKAK